MSARSDEQAPMHHWPKAGEATSCCGRLADELPIGDGRTTAVDWVTCTGEFEPAVWAHELYPHPPEDYDQPPNLADAAKYHAARAIALTSYDIDAPGWTERLIHMLAERNTAWHVAALLRGLAGQEAMDFVHCYSRDDSNELLYELCEELGVELRRIKRYAIRERRDPRSRPGKGDAQ